MMKKIYLIGILIALSMISSVSAFCQQGGSCEIFMTTGDWMGNLKSAGNGLNGVQGADNLCNSDSGRNTSKTYKALIGVPGLDGTNRLFLGTRDNFVLGTDMMNEFETFTMWYSQDDDNIKYTIRFKRGVQVAYPSQIVQFKLV